MQAGPPSSDGARRPKRPVTIFPSVCAPLWVSEWLSDILPSPVPTPVIVSCAQALALICLCIYSGLLKLADLADYVSSVGCWRLVNCLVLVLTILSSSTE
jgi:putative effector of murein hydrolase LrgA (UPF0299 family)